MAPLACLTHWYISMLYIVPVITVGGWGWWSSKRMARRKAAASQSQLAGVAERGGPAKVHPAVHFDVS